MFLKNISLTHLFHFGLWAIVHSAFPFIPRHYNIILQCILHCQYTPCAYRLQYCYQSIVKNTENTVVYSTTRITRTLWQYRCRFLRFQPVYLLTYIIIYKCVCAFKCVRAYIPFIVRVYSLSCKV